MGRSLPHRRSGWLARPLLKTPFSSPSKSPLATRDAVEALRRQRRTQQHIAEALGLSPATVSRILRARGLSLLSALEPQQTRPRYERATPGEIIHIDIKKLGRFDRVGHRITGNRTGQSNSRGVGWDYAHVAVDDHSRVATANIFPDQKKESAVAFLKSAVAYYQSLGITVTRVMTRQRILLSLESLCTGLHPARSQAHQNQALYATNQRKAERFIQTALREWAYATAFETSDQRKNQLPHWLHRYNWHRPHASLAKKTPINRLGLTRDNVLTLHI